MLCALPPLSPHQPAFIRCCVFSHQRPTTKVSNDLFEPVGHTVIQGGWNFRCRTLLSWQQSQHWNRQRNIKKINILQHNIRTEKSLVETAHVLVGRQCKSSLFGLLRQVTSILSPFNVNECQLWQSNKQMRILRSTWFLCILFPVLHHYVSISISSNQIPHFLPIPTLFSTSFQPPLETSLSFSLDGNGSPFSSPLSQPISRSRGGAAVCRYMWGETCRVKGKRTALWA